MQQQNRERYNESISPRADRSKIESQLEELFVEQFEKHLSGKVDIFPQYEVQTNAGKFRLDFVIENDNRRIAIECDGKEFHDEWRDEFRDALILGNNGVDVIYRFRGTDLFCSINECIHMIFHHDSEIFSERYRQIYNQLVSEDLNPYLEDEENLKSETNLIGLREFDEFGKMVRWKHILFERRSVSNKNSHWNKLYEFSKLHAGLNLDQIIKEREKTWAK